MQYYRYHGNIGLYSNCLYAFFLSIFLLFRRRRKLNGELACEGMPQRHTSSCFSGECIQLKHANIKVSPHTWVKAQMWQRNTGYCGSQSTSRLR